MGKFSRRGGLASPRSLAAICLVLMVLLSSGILLSTAGASRGGWFRKAGSIVSEKAASLFGRNVTPPVSAAGSAFMCTLTQQVTVTGCYFTSGSRATVSVEVGWTGAVNGDVITVSLDGGAQTRTINPESLFDSGTGAVVAGPIRTPQVVSFEITADGAAHTITSTMTGSATCSAGPTNFFAPSACAPNLCTAGELGGTVFIDPNADGDIDLGETNGVAGVTVTAYNSSNVVVGTATSDSTGHYEFSAANGNPISAGSYPVRLEFTNLPSLGYGTTTRIGTNNGSSVQFVASPQCNLNIGVMNPVDFCQSNPLLIVPCYVAGDPLPVGGGVNNAGDVDALIAFPYNSSTVTPPSPVSGPVIHLATAREIGSAWGTAYNRNTRRVFTSAVLKRHVGLGSQGLGGLYVTDITNTAAPITAPFVDLVTLGVNVGQASVPSNAARGLTFDKTATSIDSAVFPLIGKVGIGDLDISDDANTLYLVNLFDKRLYSLNITNYNNSGLVPSAGDVSSTAIPDPVCTGGQSRPFGTKFYRGKVYVGTVCDGSTSNTSNMKGTVFAYDVATTTWSTAFSFPLTYPKGYPHNSRPEYTGWYPWTDTFSDLTVGINSIFLSHPVPILSDIEFDTDGTMVLALADRTGGQIGQQNRGPVMGDPINYAVFPGGDMLRAYFSAATNVFVLENNAKAGPNTGYAQNNNQGPGFGEFYNDDFLFNGSKDHTETAQGALAIRPGSGEVIATIGDPVDNNFGIAEQSGIRRYNNTSGLASASFMVLASSRNPNSGLFGKATALGDIEVACATPNYLELGNYIWMDANRNGIQDPNEMPLQGVTVRLYRFGGPDGVVGNADDNTAVGTAVTDATGNYRFTSVDNNADGIADNDPNTADSLGLVGAPGLLPTTRYIIRLDNAANYLTGGPLFGKVLTQANADNGVFGSAGDLHDSDGGLGNVLGLANGNFPEVEVQHVDNGVTKLGTGAFGRVNHSFEFGFQAVYSIGNRVWLDNGAGGGTANDGMRNGTEPGISGVSVSLFLDVDGNGVPDTPASPVATVVTDANGYYRFDGLVANRYLVRINPVSFGAGQSLNGLLSSAGAVAAGSNQTDSKDNGVDNANPAANGILSETIDLTTKTIPTTETDNQTPGTYGVGSTTGTEATNAQTDLTVDFSFTQFTDLAITKTDNQTTLAPGSPTTYTIVVTNNGPAAVTGATVADTFPAAITSTSWTCAGSNGATCPNASGTGNISQVVNLPVGGVLTYTVTAQTSSGATGTLTNTATVTAPAGAVELNAANNSATDNTTFTPTADLSITKTDGVTTATPGGTTTYTIVATNNGPSNAGGSIVADNFPASITSASWTCAAAGGAVCPNASGTGNINQTIATFPSGGSVTYTVTANISSTATGTLVNTATVAAPAGTIEPNTTNNSATDSDTLAPSADLSITKTDGVASVIPGSSTTYTIVVTNNGPSAVTGATVADTFPAAITSASWTCAASAGSSCAAPNGAGNINTTVSLLPSGTATFTITANISATATGTLANTATVTAPPGVTDATPGNNSATDTDTLTPTADLSITKTDGVTVATPGGQTVYTIVATNNGPSAVTGATITDNFPAAITSASWICTAAGGAVCPAASGTGNISATADLPVGGSLTYTVTAQISPSATGTLTNTATIAAPGGVTDPTPANNSATDTDNLGPAADVVVQKNGPGQVQTNGTVVYAVTVKNMGPSVADGTTFSDTLPAGLTGVTAVCGNAQGGAVCPALIVGGGTVTGTLANLPVGGSLVISITGTAPATVGMLTNTATATVPAGTLEINPGNNTSSATTQVTVTPVPTAANLAVSKVGTSAVQINGAISYSVTVTNAGPGAANGASFSDTVPAAITGVTWTCTAAGGAICPNASGSGNAISETIATLPSGGQLIYTISGTAPGSAQTLTNTASVNPPAGVTDPDTNDNSSSQQTVVQTAAPTSADLVISKIGPANVAPNGVMTYTINVTNAGPGAANGAVVTDNLPNSLTGVSVVCTALGGAVCGATNVGPNNVLTATITTLPLWGNVTLMVTATAPASGSFTNIATVTPPVGVNDPDPSDNTGGPVITAVGPTVADLAITKTNGTSIVTAGATTTYTIVVTNNGPAAVTNAAINDPLPAAITGANWACAASAGSSCASNNGTGNLNTTVSLLSGGTATFTVVAQISPSATGTLTNTATVTAPPGVTDPDLNNNSATDGADTIQSVADLMIFKTDNVATAIPGGVTTYTITAMNNGPSDVTGATIADTLPATITSATWTCTGIGAVCPAVGGNGNINAVANLPAGSKLVYTVTAQISPSATGTLVNTATIAAPGGVTDPTPANNSSTDTDTLTPTADLSITKTDGVGSVTPGGSTTYSIVVTNNGPSAVTGATVADTFPASITSASWTCTAAGGAVCPNASGTGNINQTVNLPSGGSLIYTVVAQIAGAATGTLVNTATVSVPVGTNDPTPTNNTSTDTDSIIPTVDLAITNTDGVLIVTPGGSTTYTIVATNNGPSAANGSVIVDNFPPAITSASWTCTASGGAVCPATSGTGDINQTVATFPSGGSLTFTVVAQISPNATGTLTTTATITAPAGVTESNNTNNTATDVDNLVPVADLAIQKNGPAYVAANGTVVFTLEISNAGPSTIAGATVNDAVPAGIVIGSAVCSGAQGGATCGAVNVNGQVISSVIPSLPAGGSVTITITGTAPASGVLMNTATVAPPAGAVDPNTTNNTSSTVVTIAPPPTTANLAVTKLGPATVEANGAITYLVQVTNAGPGAANGATFSDAVPAAITGVAASCGGAVGGAVCGTTNVAGNNVTSTINTLPAGGSVTFTITGTAPASGTLTNTASANPPAGVTDPDTTNNSSTVNTTIGATPNTADVAAVKTGPGSVAPNGVVTYQVVLSNAGPASANGSTFSDVVPAGMTGVTAVCGGAQGGAVCGAVNVAGNTVTSTVTTLPAGGSVIITITATAPASGSFANVATITPPTGTNDPDPTDNIGGPVITNVEPNVADLAVTKTNNVVAVAPGSATTYQIVVSNNGPNAVTGASVVDNLPAAITSASWTCAASAGSTCGANSGTGNINTTVNLLSGGSATYTVVAQVSAAATGTLTNTATVATPAGVADPNPTNNSATDSDPLVPVADLRITKNDSVGTVQAGGTTTYQITVSNNGPSPVAGAAVIDPLPAAITSASWTCTASAGSSCGAASGTGGLNTTVNLLSGGSATYTLVAQISPTATGVLTNTATVAPPAGTVDPNPGDNIATDSNGITPVVDLSVTNTDGVTTVTPGGSTTYTIVAANNGPSSGNGSVLVDNFPAGITSVSWTCVAAGGAVCPAASGTGNLNEVIATFPPGGSLTYTVTAQISPNATGSLVNTATITPPAGVVDPTPGNNIATDTDNIIPVANLALQKNGPLFVAPNGTITYTIEVSNAGPSSANGASVSDTLPNGITAASATCGGVAGGAVCGAVNVNGNTVSSIIPTLPAGGSLTITITGTAPATGTLNNTASVTPPAGVTDPNPNNNNGSTVTTIITTPPTTANLGVTKVGPATVAAGGAITYLVQVTNAGPGAANGATFSDAVPAGITGVNANCGSAIGGAVCGATDVAGNNVTSTITTLPAGGSVTFTITGTASGAGPFANTATVNPPAGVTDPDTTNNSSTVNTTVGATPNTADVSAIKTGPATVNPNGLVTYQVVVSNNGPASANGASFADAVPTGLTGVAATCGGATNGAVCGAVNVTGNNVTSTITTLPAGAIVTFTITATAPASGSFVNAATVTPPVGTSDPDPTNNIGGPVVTNVQPPQADLAITKTNGVSTVVPGGTTVYTIVVTNNGAVNVTGASVTDPLPAAITSASWTCTASAGSSCGAASGTGSINTTVNLVVNGTATYTVTANIAANASGVLVNTANVAPPAGVLDATPGNNSATDTDPLVPTADLAITKTDGVTNVTPGGQTTYTIVVTNNGASAVMGAAVNDALPAAITSASWTCAASAGSSCGAASGNGNIATTVNLLPGGTATYTVIAQISQGATGTLNNTATVATPAGVVDPTPGNNSATDSSNLRPVANLTLQKNAPLFVAPNGIVTYTLEVSNAGPSSANGASVSDTLPSGITAITATCGGTQGGAVCGAVSVNGNVVSSIIQTLPAGGSLTITIIGTAPASGTLNNTASVTPPTGVTDPNPNNNNGNTITLINATPPTTANLGVTKVGPATVAANGAISYQVQVTNAGPGAANGATFSDAVPAGITAVSSNCGNAVGGAVCGSVDVTGNNVTSTINTLPAGGSVTFTIIGTATGAGPFANTATVNPPAGVTDPDTTNNSSTVNTTVGATPNSADVAAIKTGPATVNPNGLVTYQVVVSNNGPASANGASFADVVPSALTGVTAVCGGATNGAACGAVNVAGNNVTSSITTLPAGATVTFTITGTAPASGSFSNAATVTPPAGTSDPDPTNNLGGPVITNVQLMQADLAISKTDNTAIVAPGGTTTYQIVVGNNGPAAVTNAVVTDNLPAAITSATWNCAASPGSSCTASNGTGSINSTVSLLPGGTATYTVIAQISPAATGTLSNTATVAAPAGVLDPNPNNNSATDVNTLVPTADLQIQKTGPATAIAGGPLTYTILVTNAGPSNVNGAAVSDSFAASLTNVGWTCVATPGSSCTAASGTGNIATTVNLLAAGSATFIVTTTVSPNATGTIVNFAGVTAPNGVTDPNLGNNTTPPVITVLTAGADLAISKSHTGNFQVGQAANYLLRVRNVGQAATSGVITVTDTLPNGLMYLGSQGGDWTCAAAGQVVTCTNPGPMPSGAASELVLRVFVNAQAFPAVTNRATVSTPGDTNAANNTATDPTVVENGAGGQGNPYPADSPISDQKAGSILVFPVYTSDATNSNAQNTRFSLTNTDPTRSVSVHLFFVDGASCTVSDSYICLTANQTTQFLASDIDPGTTGYLVAVAVNQEGCPIYFNQLIGDEFVKFQTGHQANLGAEAISALPDLLGLNCTLGSGAVTLNFDGRMYNRLPRVLALSSIGSRADGNDTLLIVNRIGGNLGTGCATLGTLFGLLYNDQEVGLSFQLTAGSGQYRGSITNNAPRTAPRFEQFISAGRTGWLKLYSQSAGVGILGAAINQNSETSAAAGAFRQGHNLHKLTLEDSTSVVIPVFPPNCQ